MQLTGLVVECRPGVLKVQGLNPDLGVKEFSKIDFLQQKLGSLSIACDVKLERALCSVFCAEASSTWTYLNEYEPDS